MCLLRSSDGGFWLELMGGETSSGEGWRGGGGKVFLYRWHSVVELCRCGLDGRRGGHYCTSLTVHQQVVLVAAVWCTPAQACVVTPCHIVDVYGHAGWCGHLSRYVFAEFLGVI